MNGDEWIPLGVDGGYGTIIEFNSSSSLRGAGRLLRLAAGLAARDRRSLRILGRGAGPLPLLLGRGEPSVREPRRADPVLRRLVRGQRARSRPALRVGGSGAEALLARRAEPLPHRRSIGRRDPVPLQRTGRLPASGAEPGRAHLRRARPPHPRLPVRSGARGERVPRGVGRARTGTGRPARAGIYFARVDIQGKAQTFRLVLSEVERGAAGAGSSPRGMDGRVRRGRGARAPARRHDLRRRDQPGRKAPRRCGPSGPPGTRRAARIAAARWSGSLPEIAAAFDRKRARPNRPTSRRWKRWIALGPPCPSPAALIAAFEATLRDGALDLMECGRVRSRRSSSSRTRLRFDASLAPLQRPRGRTRRRPTRGSRILGWPPDRRARGIGALGFGADPRGALRRPSARRVVISSRPSSPIRSTARAKRRAALWTSPASVRAGGARATRACRSRRSSSRAASRGSQAPCSLDRRPR